MRAGDILPWGCASDACLRLALHVTDNPKSKGEYRKTETSICSYLLGFHLVHTDKTVKTCAQMQTEVAKTCTHTHTYCTH